MKRLSSGNSPHPQHQSKQADIKGFHAFDHIHSQAVNSVRLGIQCKLKRPWKGCKPNFVCAGCPAERIIYLLRPNPEPWSFPTAGRAVPWPPIWSCTQWGFPCRLACARRGGLLPHLFTLAPAEAVAVCFLWHFPSVILADKLPSVYPRRDRGYAASRPVVFGLSSPGESTPKAILHPSKIK